VLGAYTTGMEINLFPLCKRTALRFAFEAPLNSPHCSELRLIALHSSDHYCLGSGDKHKILKNCSNSCFLVQIIFTSRSIAVNSTVLKMMPKFLHYFLEVRIPCSDHWAHLMWSYAWTSLCLASSLHLLKLMAAVLRCLKKHCLRH